MKRWYDDKSMAASDRKGVMVEVRMPDCKPFLMWASATHYEGIEHILRRELRTGGTLRQDGPDWIFEADEP